MKTGYLRDLQIQVEKDPIHLSSINSSCLFGILFSDSKEAHILDRNFGRTYAPLLSS